MADVHTQRAPLIAPTVGVPPLALVARSPRRFSLERGITALLVIGPFALVAACAVFWLPAVHPRDVVIGLALYLVAGHGVTVGFHRLFTHRSFKATRPLRLVLAIAGSMSVEGSLSSWVANHRRHHAFSDRDGDPHSPHGHGRGVAGQVRGFVHAHVGWLFGADAADVERYAPDIAKDTALMRVSRMFPAIAIGSLALPFLLGWMLSGRLVGGVSALVWAGIVRMALLHHVTWSVNSVCHVFGRRPYETNDHSTNCAVLGIVSMGESWHNFHHAMPSAARHGVGRWEIDSSAALIRGFERMGWATDVRWPSKARVRSLRRPTF